MQALPHNKGKGSTGKEVEGGDTIKEMGKEQCFEGKRKAVILLPSGKGRH